MFYLCILEFDEIVGALRVVLAQDHEGGAAGTFEAHNWIEARDLVDTQHLRHVPGYGWFVKS